MSSHPNAPLPRIDKRNQAVEPEVVNRGIPAALASRRTSPNWVGWRWIWNETRWDKPPLRARDLCNASTAKPGSWTTADQAETAAGRHGLGIGYVLTNDADLCVLDLDNVIDDDGVVAPWALALILECGSYTERSPSGRGFKIFGTATGLGSIDTKVAVPTGELEIFHHARRYVTITGASDAPDAALADLTGVVSRYLPEKGKVLATNSKRNLPSSAVAGATEGNEPRRKDVARALDGYWSPDDYADWVKAALALHAVDWGEEVWLDWAAKSSKFEHAENSEKWGQTTPTGGITPRTILDRVPKSVLRRWGMEHSGEVPPARSFEEMLAAARSIDPDDCDAVAALVAETARLDPIKSELVLAAIKKRTGIGIGALRAQLHSAGKFPQIDHLGLARLVLNEIGSENILFTDGALWSWTSTGVWQEQDDRVLKRGLQRLADAQGVSISATLVNGALDVFKSEVMAENHRFNLGDPETVNCLNGELELCDTGLRLVPHRREHYRSTQIPVAYDRGAKAPAFTAFLEQVFRDDPDKPDKMRAVLELIGYSLMSHARHEKFVILIGTGANGKSVLLAIVEALCGADNVAGVQPSKFNSTFQRAHLNQKLANIVTELKQGEVIADAELKAITSGERSTVEHKNRDPFEMRPFCTCWFGANHMPHTRDFSDALFRRAVILTFNRVFNGREQDPLMKDKLKAELPGILNLALDAYAMALRVGFTNPPSAGFAKEEWRLEADQVAQFVDERCERNPMGKQTNEEVFSAYQSWAGDQGIVRTVAKKGLRQRLSRLGFGEARVSNERFVTGITLRGELCFDDGS